MLPSVASSQIRLTCFKSELGQQRDMGPTAASLSLKRVQTVRIALVYYKEWVLQKLQNAWSNIFYINQSHEVEVYGEDL